MSLPLLNRLWKGIAFFAFLIFIFLSLTFFKTSPVPMPPEEEAPGIYTEICLLIASGVPVNVDTVFSLKANINRIFAYSFLGADFTDTVWHSWYRGSEMVQTILCEQENSACFSSISSDNLQVGNWSVDTRKNGVLLNIKQFKIEK